MTHQERRAAPCRGRPSHSMSSGGDEQQSRGSEGEHNLDGAALQLAAYRQADDQFRAALSMRGGERLRCIAVAVSLRHAAYRAGLNSGAPA